MRTRNGTCPPSVAVAVESLSLATKTSNNTRSTRRNKEVPGEVLKPHSSNTPAKTDPVLPRATTKRRGQAKNVDKENVTAVQSVQVELGGRKRGKPQKQETIVPEPTLTVENVPVQRRGRGKKSAEVAVEEPKVAPAESDAPKKKRGRAEKKIIGKEESVSVQPVAETKAKEDLKIPDRPVVGRRGRAKKLVAETEEIVERQEPQVPEKVKSVEQKKIDPPIITAKPTTTALVSAPESPPPQPPPSIPSSSVSTKNPAMNKQQPPPIQQVPLQRSPVYLPTHQQPTTALMTIATPVNNSSSTPSVQKRSAIDDPFQLMPLKPRTKRQKVEQKSSATKSTTTTTDPDDVYGFEFNESSEPPTQKKKPTKGKTTAKAKTSRAPKQPRQTNKVVKKQEPTALKLWDEKDFNQRQRQIKINLVNKDFKPPQKPIPPPPQQFTKAKLQMNSTMKESESEIIPIADVVEPEEVSRNKLPELSHNNLSIGSSPSKLIPWRYSTIRSASSSLVHSLNHSNAENMTPTAIKSKAQSILQQRPLHTLQPQRSPMKELNPNETILVPRPPAHKFRSPMQKTRTTFGLENNFGFESDTEDLDEENLDMERRKIDDKIDSLKRFRHSLNAGNSSSPVAPIRARNAAAAAPRQVAGLRNIFTSTPQQQVTIREAFEASTPIAGPSKRPETAATTTTNESNPKLFESLTFEAPPKRNYSLLPPKRKRRVDFLGCSDDDGSEDEVDMSTTLERSMDEGQPAGKAKQATKKSKVQKVQEEKLAQFVDEFNSMCDEVDQYEMVIE